MSTHTNFSSRPLVSGHPRGDDAGQLLLPDIEQQLDRSADSHDRKDSNAGKKEERRTDVLFLAGGATPLDRSDIAILSRYVGLEASACIAIAHDGIVVRRRLQVAFTVARAVVRCGRARRFRIVADRQEWGHWLCQRTRLGLPDA